MVLSLAMVDDIYRLEAGRVGWVANGEGGMGKKGREEPRDGGGEVEDIRG